MILPRIKITKNRILGHWNGITLPPFGIFVWSGSSDPMKLIRHEFTHFLQALELGVVLYYPVYAWEWMRAGFSYSGNRMEREAYDNDEDPSYNGQRKPYAWRDYES